MLMQHRQAGLGPRFFGRRHASEKRGTPRPLSYVLSQKRGLLQGREKQASYVGTCEKVKYSSAFCPVRPKNMFLGGRPPVKTNWMDMSKSRAASKELGNYQ